MELVIPGGLGPQVKGRASSPMSIPLRQFFHARGEGWGYLSRVPPVPGTLGSTLPWGLEPALWMFVVRMHRLN